MQQKLDRLVRNYRVRGHRLAELSPLGRDPFEIPELDPGYYGISQADMDRPVLAPVISGANTVGLDCATVGCSKLSKPACQ